MIRIATFTVRGRGAFPTTLLDVDDCRPASRKDEREIGRQALREVTLASETGAGPRPALWAAQGWQVTCWQLAKSC